MEKVAVSMRNKKTHVKPVQSGDPDDKVVNDLMATRKLQQNALMKIMASMGKAGGNETARGDGKEADLKTKKKLKPTL
jgi:hypothetical protein